jgi:murein DD-endopeptidase MepM/ murein hydrolase activator NlpD
MLRSRAMLSRRWTEWRSASGSIHVARESWVALRNLVAFSRSRRELDSFRLAGNHVIVQAGQTYALYAHLAPGSVAVTNGNHVRAGDVVGRVGHTGSSTAPHLHFQLVDSGNPAQANGIPCAFAAYMVLREGRWERVECGIPDRLARIRSVL